jgi:hypothetical protein
MQNAQSRLHAAADKIETKVTRYGTRYWAVYLNHELLAVTLYKKGALAVQRAVIASTAPKV